jgi:hypothetical protein
MRKTMARYVLPLALALITPLASACSGDAERLLFGDSSARPPIGVQDGLFFMSRADTAITLDLAGDTRIEEHALSSPIAASVPRIIGGSDVVVLTTGIEARNEDGKRKPPVNSELLLFNRERQILAQPYPLKGRFQQLAVSEDGRFAIAYAPTGVGAQNAVTVIDLAKVELPDAAAQNAAQSVNFSLSGIAPTRFIFSPPGVGKRRLVVVPFPDSVQLLDLEKPAVGLTSIPLKTANDPRMVVPTKVLFAGDRIFVQASTGAQVFAITLLDSSNPANLHGFEPSFAVLPTRNNVFDIAIVGEAAQQRLLALADRLEVFDPTKGSSVSLEGVSTFRALLPFVGTSPVDNIPSSRALVYTPNQSQIGFVDLIGESEWTTRTLETLDVGTPIVALLPLPTRKLALALHNAAKLSVIDLEKRTVGPLVLDGVLVDWLVDETSARTKLWLLTERTLAVTDLPTLATEEIPLAVTVGYAPFPGDEDDGATGLSRSRGHLTLIPGATSRRIAVMHESEAGRITLIDAEAPTARERWLELTGYSLAGLLD